MCRSATRCTWFEDAFHRWLLPTRRHRLIRVTYVRTLFRGTLDAWKICFASKSHLIWYFRESPNDSHMFSTGLPLFHTWNPGLRVRKTNIKYVDIYKEQLVWKPYESSWKIYQQISSGVLPLSAVCNPIPSDVHGSAVGSCIACPSPYRRRVLIKVNDKNTSLSQYVKLQRLVQ